MSATKRKGREARLESAIEDLLEKLVVHQGKIDWDFVPNELATLSDVLVAVYMGQNFSFAALESTDFVKHALGALLTSDTALKAVDGKVQELLPADDLHALKERAFQQAASLPWEYRVAYPVCRFEPCPWHTTWLAGYLGRSGDPLTVNAAQLVSECSFSIDLGSRRRLEKVLPGEYEIEGCENWLWLHLDLKGYWTAERYPALIEAAAREARALSGILLATGHLTSSPSSNLADRDRLAGRDVSPAMQLIQAHSFAVNRHERKRVWPLHALESRVLNDVRLATEYAALACPDWEGDVNSPELQKSLGFIRGLFDEKREVLVEDRKGKKRDARMAIRLAGYWYAVSKANAQDSLAAFTFLMLAFEALLGDPNSQERIQGRLADRAAYLIGETLESRARIADRIVAAYRLRSEVFHTGRYDVFQGEFEELEKPFDLGLDYIFSRCLRRLCEEYGFTLLPPVRSNRLNRLH